MKDFQVSRYNFEEFLHEMKVQMELHQLVIVSAQPASTGKWGMARLWRSWMATTAKYMAANGAMMPLMIKQDGSWYGQRQFDANDAHELFTRQWLGVDENGYRLSWAKTGNQRKATKGERFNALRRHEHWCIEKGITLFKPRGSEYEQLEKEQEQ